MGMLAFHKAQERGVAQGTVVVGERVVERVVGREMTMRMMRRYSMAVV